MPLYRTEPTPGPDAASTVVPAPAPAAPRGGGFQAWLPLIITVLFMPVLAYFMTTLVLVPRLQKGLGVTATAPAATREPEVKKSSPPARKETVMMNKLLVNIAGTMGARYLLVSLSVAGSDAEFKTKVQEVEPQLRDLACGALASKTLADLEKPGARNLIRGELISGFNGILGGPLVQEIYLTEFAIQ
jgi:flagellar protein FliL